MVNLVVNSIEAMKAASNRPRILRVSSGLDDTASVSISVEDSGVGIGVGLLDRIFDPLFTTKREGMGMGLSIDRSIIDAHEWRLWAEPRLPQGSIFRFTLSTRSRRSH
jgi:signal transduction histidine kinase